MDSITHDPGSLLIRRGFGVQRESPENSGPFLIVLNQPILCPEAFRRCYENAQWRIYADGGANRVKDFEENIYLYPPEIIHGDLDSLKPDTRKHYLPGRAIITHDGDLYSTDFGKSLNWIRLLQQTFPGFSSPVLYVQSTFPASWDTVVEYADVISSLPKPLEPPQGSNSEVSDVIVLGGLGGRVDQGIGLLSEFAREEERNKGRLRFWLVSERSVSWVLHPVASSPSNSAGESQRLVKHRIKLSPPSSGPDEQLFSPNVGVLPIFGPAQICMRGFEWDVEGWHTEMGAQMSTSNHVVSGDGVVEVEATGKVLFTVEMGEGLLQGRE